MAAGRIRAFARGLPDVVPVLDETNATRTDKTIRTHAIFWFLYPLIA